MRFIAYGKIVKRMVFVEGEDFELNAGSIFLGSNFEGANDIAVGASYSRSVIGLDMEGNGKYRSSGAAAGVALLVIPIAVIGRSDIRFKRVN